MKIAKIPVGSVATIFNWYPLKKKARLPTYSALMQDHHAIKFISNAD